MSPFTRGTSGLAMLILFAKKNFDAVRILCYYNSMLGPVNKKHGIAT